LLWGTLFFASKKKYRCQTSGVGGAGVQRMQAHIQKFGIVESSAKSLKMLAIILKIFLQKSLKIPTKSPNL